MVEKWEERMNAFCRSDAHNAAAAATSLRLSAAHRCELFDVAKSKKDLYDARAAKDQVSHKSLFPILTL